MGMVKEFREFALKGNVLDLAVGVIIGAAFGKIVSSLTENIIMPPIGMALNKVDFSSLKIELQKAQAETVVGGQVVPAVNEVAIYYGKFINTVIDFTIVAFCIFLIVKAFNMARKRFEAEKAAAAPAGPTPSELLLKEIRDELRARPR